MKFIGTIICSVSTVERASSSIKAFYNKNTSDKYIKFMYSSY